jgi:2-isopropylmalate synthase
VRWVNRDISVAAPKRVRGQSQAQEETHEQHAQRVAAALGAAAGQPVEVTSVESARTSDGRTAVFVGCRVGEQAVRYGVGVNEENAAAVVDAVVSAVNRCAWKHADQRAAA